MIAAASLILSLIATGVARGDADFSRFDYRLTITNDSADPLYGLDLDIPAPRQVVGIRDGWRFDTVVGVQYWSLQESTDLAPGESTSLTFEAGSMGGMAWRAYFWDATTWEETAAVGSAELRAPRPMEVPDPGTLAVLGSAAALLFRRAA